MRPTAFQLRLEGGLGLAPGTGRAVVGPLGLYLGPGDARVRASGPDFGRSPAGAASALPLVPAGPDSSGTCQGNLAQL